MTYAKPFQIIKNNFIPKKESQRKHNMQFTNDYLTY